VERGHHLASSDEFSRFFARAPIGRAGRSITQAREKKGFNPKGKVEKAPFASGARIALGSGVRSRRATGTAPSASARRPSQTRPRRDSASRERTRNMATAVQGKVPAHKAPVNHEESDDDVDDDDVRSLPPLLLFRRRTRRATRDRGSAGPRPLVHPPFARFPCSEPAPRSASVARVLSETLRSTVTGPSPDPGMGIRLVLFLTHAPLGRARSPPNVPATQAKATTKSKKTTSSIYRGVRQRPWGRCATLVDRNRSPRKEKKRAPRALLRSREPHRGGLSWRFREKSLFGERAD